MYHDAKNVLFSANTFDISRPSLVPIFIQRLSHVSGRNLAIRSVHLLVEIEVRNEERRWDKTFHALAEAFKNLRHLYIHFDIGIWDCGLVTRYSPAHPRSKPFLLGLLELKKLSLKTVDVIVAKSYSTLNLGNAYTWTDAQKRDWAQKMKDMILAGPEDEVA